MTLEQRLAAVEAELASLKAQQKASEDIAELLRKTTIETIKSAQRPGGVLYRSEDVTITVGGVEIKPTHAEVKAANSTAAGDPSSMSVAIHADKFAVHS